MKKKLVYMLGSLLLLSSCQMPGEKQDMEFPKTEWAFSYAGICLL